MPGRPNSDLLDLVYEAAFDPALWEPVMERIADDIGGGSGWLSQLSVADGSGGQYDDPMSRVAPEWPQRYLDHFATCNPLHNVPDTDAYFRGWRTKVVFDTDIIAKADLVRTEYYNDFMRGLDAHSVVMFRLARRGDEIAVLNLNRPERRGPFSGAELDYCEALHPHLIRAYELGERFGATRRLSGELAMVLDHSPHGLFLLSDDGVLRHANRNGERMLAQAGALRVSGGRLTATNPADARRLHALIGAAGSNDGERRSSGSMALPTPNRRLPLSVTVSPVRSQRFAPFAPGHSIVVCVTDLEAGVSVPEQRLRELFGLTPAETRLALAIFDGQTPAEAAETLGITHNTARNQLARVFEKTGANRQAALVRLIMRSVGVELRG